MAKPTDTKSVDDLIWMIGELSNRHAELLDCIREIRIARTPGDLGIPTPIGLVFSPIVPSVDPPPVATDLVAPDLPIVPSEGSPPPKPAAMKRDYDYFTDLETRIAATAKGGDGEVGEDAD